MSSYQHRKSHCGDKMVVRSSYLHNEISYTDKMTSLYWIRALVTLLVELVTTENSMDQLYEILSKHWFTFQLKPHTMLVFPSFAIKLVTDEDQQHHHRKAVRFWTSGLTEFGCSEVCSNRHPGRFGISIPKATCTPNQLNCNYILFIFSLM